MKTNLSALIAGLCLIALTVGCYHSVDGRNRAGTPFVKDRIESRYERPLDQIFEAAREVLAFNGTLTGENRISNSLEARIDNSKVWVKLDEVEPSICRVMVQARKSGGGGNVALASEIDKQIALQLQAR
ncbi:MAG TPA: hypothetical protein PKK20_05110 [Verrucomicrobiota bacterium]|jgi:hypothetical protein|nr:hypothetical protein [Verrucomicrobiota bacterium]NMD21022.1 DUF3568 family protein [Verrucomicrobiota bacterium]HNU99297.1 hypothetical protein [Verrucomicrobiota bacterium]HOA62134.1 hypothetical protein [Verrucomicrobiota bacterium]HOF49540.1 hypothetical protein [Verrucomicrobiota bacterium]